MNLNEYSQILDDISSKNVPQDVNLLPCILSKVQKQNSSRMKLQTRVAFTFLSFVLVITLLFTIPSVATAMRKLLGFIPGIGLVNQDSPLRILAAPSTDSRDGFTLTVEDAVLDAEHSVITYKVEGPFGPDISQPAVSLAKICFAAAELRLPDGTVYQVPAGLPNLTWQNGYRVQFTYPAIPADVNQAVLMLPCLNSRSEDSAPQNWQIPLTFVPAPENLTIYTVGLQNTPSSDSNPANLNGISVNLENVIPLADGQLVQVRVDWRNNPDITSVVIDTHDIEILDASGQPIPFEPSNEAIEQRASDPQSVIYGFKTAPLTDLSQASLVIKSASQVTYKVSLPFVFDPGKVRLPSQTWQINRDFEIAGRILRILNLSVVETDGNATLSVEMQSADGIIAAEVIDSAHPARSGASSLSETLDSPVQQFWTSFNYDGKLPEGALNLQITGYTVRQPGSWNIAWTPKEPPSSSMIAPDLTQKPCLTEAAWKEAFAQPSSIPSELNQQVLVEVYDPETAKTQLALTKLDGTDLQPIIENGSYASLSPDGTRVLYFNNDGSLMQYDLASGRNTQVSNLDASDGFSNIYWSADGKQIVFSGTSGPTPPDIYISNLDGSEPKHLANDETLKLVQGWLPDGRILYVTQDVNGPVLKLIDPRNMETSTLFNVSQLNNNISLSKDGLNLSINFQNLENGNQSLYAIGQDGSQRKALLEVSSDGYIQPANWSPDGKWLLVNLSWSIPGEDYSQALINVESCQVIPLKDLPGQVIGW